MEHFARDDPRFLAGNTLIYYETDSLLNTIDRTYGTVDQKIKYPKYTDLVGMGVWSLPKPNFKLEEEHFSPTFSYNVLQPGFPVSLRNDTAFASDNARSEGFTNGSNNKPCPCKVKNSCKKSKENFSIGYNDQYVTDQFYE